MWSGNLQSIDASMSPLRQTLCPRSDNKGARGKIGLSIHQGMCIPLRLLSAWRVGNNIGLGGGFLSLIVIEINFLLGVVLPLLMVCLYALWRTVLWVWSRRLRQHGQMTLARVECGQEAEVADLCGRLSLRGDEATVVAVQHVQRFLSEPELFRRRSWIPTWLVLGWFLVPLQFNSRLIEHELARVGLEGYGRPAFFGVIAVFAVVAGWRMLAPSLRKHKCYRVLPGRIDEMEVDPLSTTVSTSRKIELKDRRIICDVAAKALRISGDERGWEWVRIDLRSVDSPLEFVRCVFQAAATDRATPALPDDQFVG